LKVEFITLTSFYRTTSETKGVKLFISHKNRHYFLMLVFSHNCSTFTIVTPREMFKGTHQRSFVLVLKEKIKYYNNHIYIIEKLK